MWNFTEECDVHGEAHFRQKKKKFYKWAKIGSAATSLSQKENSRLSNKEKILGIYWITFLFLLLLFLLQKVQL